MKGFSKRAIATARKSGREYGYAVLANAHHLTDRGNPINVGLWWAMRPSTWLQEVVKRDDDPGIRSWDLYELDQHWLMSANSVLTPAGWRLTIGTDDRGKWNDAPLLLERTR